MSNFIENSHLPSAFGVNSGYALAWPSIALGSGLLSLLHSYYLHGRDNMTKVRQLSDAAAILTAICSVLTLVAGHAVAADDKTTRVILVNVLVHAICGRYH